MLVAQDSLGRFWISLHFFQPHDIRHYLIVHSVWWEWEKKLSNHSIKCGLMGTFNIQQGLDSFISHQQRQVLLGESGKGFQKWSGTKMSFLVCWTRGKEGDAARFARPPQCILISWISLHFFQPHNIRQNLIFHSVWWEWEKSFLTTPLSVD